ncbi:hypothetical protein P4N68_07915 [Corynebacterium felinum]|uniref:WXG100 family type VII secretion target n=1 Tax=Corynebacterium felinum TaxID=131318 RepID=A0ABU2BC42_9CORY|nr:hypothetical protein [Corynebacterium felinum]MDF5821004.1 hypothetical protein [Corynebacterium felinum]MDR7356185.1 hypothetical protein [Corynebacterium felinum]WJY95519.1 hypothetical protein CFELI_09580 [Corynebacterium felinum]
MDKEIDFNAIATYARNAAHQLREIALFLENIDALDGDAVSNWEGMGTRFFFEERSSLLDIADVLDGELAQKANPDFS